MWRWRFVYSRLVSHLAIFSARGNHLAGSAGQPKKICLVWNQRQGRRVLGWLWDALIEATEARVVSCYQFAAALPTASNASDGRHQTRPASSCPLPPRRSAGDLLRTTKRTCRTRRQGRARGAGRPGSARPSPGSEDDPHQQNCCWQAPGEHHHVHLSFIGLTRIDFVELGIHLSAPG